VVRCLSDFLFIRVGGVKAFAQGIEGTQKFLSKGALKLLPRRFHIGFRDEIFLRLKPAVIPEQSSGGKSSGGVSLSMEEQIEIGLLVTGRNSLSSPPAPESPLGWG